MLCLENNDYIKNRFLTHSRWEAFLSNGLICYEDEFPNEKSCWLRLKDYLYNNKIYINRIQIRFRDNIISSLPNNAQGYMIRNGVVGILNKKKSYKTIIIGYLTAFNTVYTETYRCPDMTKINSEIRDPNDLNKVGESLILNNL